jgi:hypothetical protein
MRSIRFLRLRSLMSELFEVKGSFAECLTWKYGKIAVFTTIYYLSSGAGVTLQGFSSEIDFFSVFDKIIFEEVEKIVKWLRYERLKMMFKGTLRELKAHAPFTLFGAVTGIVIMVFFRNLPAGLSYDIFYTLHPIHVVLSALVTASMFAFHKCEASDGKAVARNCNFPLLLIIGYTGSVGIATISDSLIPYAAETLLDLPNRGVHIGFIEKWWLVNPLAVLGVVIAYFKPGTKFPHAAHVLLSTWASLFHIIMAMGESIAWFLYIPILIFLFLAVWLPCCVSDIVFPLLFVKK